MATRFKVTQGNEIWGPGGTIFKAGSMLPRDLFKGPNDPLLKEYMRDRRVTPTNDSDHSEAARLTPSGRAPGAETTALPGMSPDPRDNFALSEKQALKIDGSGGSTTTSLPAEPQAKIEETGDKNPNEDGTKSKWVLDPATLGDKNLDQLNALLVEREPDAVLFTDADEARAFLSQDFTAA